MKCSSKWKNSIESLLVAVSLEKFPHVFNWNGNIVYWKLIKERMKKVEEKKE